MSRLSLSITKLPSTPSRILSRLQKINVVNIRFRAAGRGLPLTPNERRLLALRDAYAGRRGFVLGNGPSLLHNDLDMLKDEVTIASNGIFLLFDRTVFRPTFYTIEDVLVAEDRAEQACALQGMTKVFPIDLRRWLRPDANTVYINFVRQYPGAPAFSGEFAKRVNFGGTVTFLNLQLAFYLGLREVYLIGFDHRYEPKKEVDEQTGNVILSNTDDVNHFHPDYFGKGFRWHDPKVDRMEASYRKAKAFFEADGRKIYNATHGGNLEVFDRRKFECIFG